MSGREGPPKPGDGKGDKDKPQESKDGRSQSASSVSVSQVDNPQEPVKSEDKGEDVEKSTGPDNPDVQKDLTLGEQTDVKESSPGERDKDKDSTQESAAANLPDKTRDTATCTRGELVSEPKMPVSDVNPGAQRPDEQISSGESLTSPFWDPGDEVLQTLQKAAEALKKRSNLSFLENVEYGATPGTHGASTAMEEFARSLAADTLRSVSASDYTGRVSTRLSQLETIATGLSEVSAGLRQFASLAAASIISSSVRETSTNRPSSSSASSTSKTGTSAEATPTQAAAATTRSDADVQSGEAMASQTHSTTPGTDVDEMASHVVQAAKRSTAVLQPFAEALASQILRSATRPTATSPETFAEAMASQVLRSATLTAAGVQPFAEAMASQITSSATRTAGDMHAFADTMASQILRSFTRSGTDPESFADTMASQILQSAMRTAAQVQPFANAMASQILGSATRTTDIHKFAEALALQILLSLTSSGTNPESFADTMASQILQSATRTAAGTLASQINSTTASVTNSNADEKAKAAVESMADSMASQLLGSAISEIEFNIVVRPQDSLKKKPTGRKDTPDPGEDIHSKSHDWPGATKLGQEEQRTADSRMTQSEAKKRKKRSRRRSITYQEYQLDESYPSTQPPRERSAPVSRDETKETTDKPETTGYETEIDQGQNTVASQKEKRKSKSRRRHGRKEAGMVFPPHTCTEVLNHHLGGRDESTISVAEWLHVFDKYEDAQKGCLACQRQKIEETVGAETIRQAPEFFLQNVKLHIPELRNALLQLRVSTGQRDSSEPVDNERSETDQPVEPLQQESRAVSQESTSRESDPKKPSEVHEETALQEHKPTEASSQDPSQEEAIAGSSENVDVSERTVIKSEQSLDDIYRSQGARPKVKSSRSSSKSEKAKSERHGRSKKTQDPFLNPDFNPDLAVEEREGYTGPLSQESASTTDDQDSEIEMSALDDQARLRDFYYNVSNMVVTFNEASSHDVQGFAEGVVNELSFLFSEGTPEMTQATEERQTQVSSQFHEEIASQISRENADVPTSTEIAEETARPTSRAEVEDTARQAKDEVDVLQETSEETEEEEATPSPRPANLSSFLQREAERQGITPALAQYAPGYRLRRLAHHMIRQQQQATVKTGKVLVFRAKIGRFKKIKCHYCKGTGRGRLGRDCTHDSLSTDLALYSSTESDSQSSSDSDDFTEYSPVESSTDAPKKDLLTVPSFTVPRVPRQRYGRLPIPRQVNPVLRISSRPAQTTPPTFEIPEITITRSQNRSGFPAIPPPIEMPPSWKPADEAAEIPPTDTTALPSDPLSTTDNLSPPSDERKESEKSETADTTEHEVDIAVPSSLDPLSTTADAQEKSETDAEMLPKDKRVSAVERKAGDISQTGERPSTTRGAYPLAAADERFLPGPSSRSAGPEEVEHDTEPGLPRVSLDTRRAWPAPSNRTIRVRPRIRRPRGGARTLEQCTFCARPLNEVLTCEVCEKPRYCRQKCKLLHFPIHQRSCFYKEKKCLVVKIVRQVEYFPENVFGIQVMDITGIECIALFYTESHEYYVQDLREYAYLEELLVPGAFLFLVDPVCTYFEFAFCGFKIRDLRNVFVLGIPSGDRVTRPTITRLERPGRSGRPPRPRTAPSGLRPVPEVPEEPEPEEPDPEYPEPEDPDRETDI